MTGVQDTHAAPRWTTRRWLAYAAVTLLLVAMAAYAARAQDELASIRRLSATVLVAATILQFASQIFLNGSMLLPLQACVKALGFWELYLVRLGGSFAGSLVPLAGGVGIRLAYLRGHGLTYLDFTWATILSNMMGLAAAGVLAAGATAVLWALAGPPPALVVAVSAGVLVVSVAALAALEFLPQLARYPALARWPWLVEMRSVKAMPGLASWVFVHSLLRHAFNFATFGLLYQALARGPGDFLTGGLVYALTSPIRMVNITPANLGVNEWFVAFVGRVLAFDLVTGLIVALAFRGIGLVSQALGALVGSAWLALGSRA